MTSLSCGVEALLRAAQFLDEQENGQIYRPLILETSKLSTGKKQHFHFSKMLQVRVAKNAQNTFRAFKTVTLSAASEQMKELSYAAMFKCVYGKSCHH